MPIFVFHINLLMYFKIKSILSEKYHYSHKNWEEFCEEKEEYFSRDPIRRKRKETID